MAAVKNITTGARGAYAKGVLVMAEPGEVIEADDFAGEWFAEEKPVKAEPAPKPEAKATEAKK
jgi:hypothetical protein